VSTLSPLLEALFTERLIGQRNASPHTIAAYRDTYRQLLRYTATRTGRPPERLDLTDLDAPTIGAFLQHLEDERHVSIRTRNLRLTAIRVLFQFATYRHPEHAALIQRVLAIPPKRTVRNVVTYLTEPETTALLAAPDRTTRTGRRDHALLLVAVQTGLRVSELTALVRTSVHLGTGAHVRCHGKGRKERVTPLRRDTRTVLKAWLTEHDAPDSAPLFPGPAGRPLTRDAIRRIIDRHVTTATANCPSLAAKTITPHTLRHTCAMTLLRHGIDTATIALILGHEDIRTTYRAYLHADLNLKEQALARTCPPGTTSGRYRPPDRLLTYLESL
jgi:site-specific recombinase XerD